MRCTQYHVVRYIMYACKLRFFSLFVPSDISQAKIYDILFFYIKLTAFVDI